MVSVIFLFPSSIELFRLSLGGVIGGFFEYRFEYFGI